MFYIYKKTHNVTGLMYLGYTKKNPYTYTGSGVRWLKHLEKHGDDVTTEIICECSTKDEIKEKGKYYSNLWNVAKSKEWANMKIEEGDGGDMSYSEKWVNGRKSPEFRKKQSDGAKGNTNVRNYKWWCNTITGEKTRSLESPGENWINQFQNTTDEAKIAISKALKGKSLSDIHKQRLKEAAKNRPSNAKGTVWVKNAEGQRKRVNPNNIPEGYERVNK